MSESCAELKALGCDLIEPSFQFGGLEPSYAVMVCVHEGAEPPNAEYFRRRPGLDTRYRSYVIFQDGTYRLIMRGSDFRKVFAPIESNDEAISYAMAITSLQSRHDLDPGASVDYLVDLIEETHAEETPDGYLVYLFDWDRKMGCSIHSYYSVKVLVTQDGDVREVERQEIYRAHACADYGVLTLTDG